MAEKYNQPSVSVIVPGLNEAGNIEKAISVIIEALKKQNTIPNNILLQYTFFILLPFLNNVFKIFW